MKISLEEQTKPANGLDELSVTGEEEKMDRPTSKLPFIRKVSYNHRLTFNEVHYY